MNTKRAKSQEHIAKSKGQRFKSQKIFTLYFLLFALSYMLLAAEGYAAQNGQIGRIAIFPFENFSEDRDALTYVMHLITNKLDKKFDILDEDRLDEFLLKERIRSTGYVSTDIAGKLREELNVEAILIGSINTFEKGDSPTVGFSARLVRSSDGKILWANHAAANGEDFTTILNLGRITDIGKLTSKVLDELLHSFSVVPPAKETESTFRIAVMPFQNETSSSNVGKIATNLFIVELFKSGKFEPIEFGEVRRLIVDLRVREKGEINFKNIEAISDSSGVDGILVGTVEIYNEGLDNAAPPEVSISARLIDARKGRIIWSDFNEFKGDEDIVVLDWGRIRSVENAAYKAVTALVKEIDRVKWNNT
ncbi:MAG: CsgG/HfaB family protein [Nitrospirota bacterium]